MVKNNPIFFESIAGLDEAGRGPLAGPVVAAVVILDPRKPIKGLTDSKLLTPKQRQVLYELIQERALAWAVGRSSVVEIDQINILQATFLAMQRAVSVLKIIPEMILVDGNRCPLLLPCKARAIVRGDYTEPVISAASIIAKVTRDTDMQQLHQEFPVYDFLQHKGYPTKQHIMALQKYGPCASHRVTFAPVARVLRT